MSVSPYQENGEDVLLIPVCPNVWGVWNKKLGKYVVTCNRGKNCCPQVTQHSHFKQLCPDTLEGYAGDDEDNIEPKEFSCHLECKKTDGTKFLIHGRYSQDFHAAYLEFQHQKP